MTLDVGNPGDRLVLTGINGDERDGGITYRWTTTRTTLAIPGWGGVRRAHIEVTARSGRAAPGIVPYAVETGGAAQPLGARGEWTLTQADPDRPTGGADLPIVFTAPRYAAPGDSRILGVQIARVRVEPLQSDWLAGAVGGWSWAVRLALFAVVVAAARGGRWRGLFGGGVALVVALAVVSVPELRLVLPPLLVPASVVVAGVALARQVWQWRGRIGAARERLAAFPVRHGAMVFAALDRPAVARAVVGGLIAVYVVGAVAVISQVDFIGHADYADNAVRARNIVAGRGDTVDYVAQFYRVYPAGISHPAETWPPLHPWLIALAFRVFGVSTAAAKLPNVAIMAGLLAFVAAVGAARWGRRVGVVAAGLLAANVPFFAGVLMPLNDLAFAILFGCFAVAACAAWAGTNRNEPPRHQDTKSQSKGFIAKTQRMQRKNENVSLLAPFASWRFGLPIFLAGLCAGLLVLAKPSGAVLVVGGAVAVLLAGRANGRRLREQWRGVLGAAVAAAVYAPWAVRNLVTFGTPFFSTETADAWALKYDPKQPTEGIYAVFAGRELPHPRLLIGYGLDHFLAVQGREVSRFLVGLADGSLVPGVVIVFAVLGMVVSVGGKAGGQAETYPAAIGSLGYVLAGAFALYTPFVLLYWHYEARYFLVFVPWLLLYAAHGLLWAGDALAAVLARSRAGFGLPSLSRPKPALLHSFSRVVPALLAAAVLLTVAVPGARGIVAEAQQQTSGNEMVVIGRWLAENTPPDAVVMTRNPWEVSWHSGRRTVMLPLGTADEIYAKMRQYGVTVLQLDHINDFGTIRQSVLPLYSYREQPGITRLHYDPDANGVASYLIFRVEPDKLLKGSP